MGYPVMTSTSASLQATAMASLPVMRDVWSSAGFCSCFGECAITSAMISPPAGRARRKPLPGTGRGCGRRASRPILDPCGEMGLVSGLVLAPGLPLAGVVLELRLVHHGDAEGHRADR